MRAYAFSLGGSFLTYRQREARKFIRLVKAWDNKSVIVVGGGSIARDEIAIARSLGISEERTLHEIGIKATYLNAYAVCKALGAKLYYKDPRKINVNSKIIVTGGYIPGWTTDVGAAYAAQSINSPVMFNLSKEAGVYDSDPNKNPKAKLIKELTFEEAEKMQGKERKPGMSYIIDPKSIEICRKNSIKIVVTNKVADIKRFIAGKEIFGSVIG